MLIILIENLEQPRGVVGQAQVAAGMEIPTGIRELKARIAQRTKKENAIRSQAAHDG
jgi:hypothetical protein